MEEKINSSKIILIQGDITKESTDAIVNAANIRLVGGGGVDGAIHHVGGPTILQECRKIGGCPIGQAVITKGGNLKAKHVIHTVGPIYHGGGKGEDKLLKSAYLESLKLATKNNIKSISFPAISTGAYGYPIHQAAHIALKTILDYIKENQDIKIIRFVLYENRIYDIFSKELKKLIIKK